MAFEYIPQAEKVAISSTGGGLQIALLIAFCLQLGLKLALKNTMQYLWDTVHQMQFMNYILLLQISFPSNLYGLVDFFDIASGRIEQLDNLVPSMPSFILDDEQLEHDYNLLPESFEEHGIESPFFLVNYQQSVLMGLLFASLIIPGYLISKKCFPK